MKLSGALIALPVLRSAVLMLRDVALLADLSMRAEPVDKLRTAPVEAPIGALRQAQGT